MVKQRNRRIRLSPELLEDRLAPAAVLTVNSALDSDLRDSVLTFREAIRVVNRDLDVTSLSSAERIAVVGTPTSSDTDTIRFALSPAGVGHFYYRDDGVAGRVSRAGVGGFTLLGGTEVDDTELTPAQIMALIPDIDPDYLRTWYSLQPTTPLPIVTDPVIIDGYSQSGASPNTLKVGNDAVLRVELNGERAGVGAVGLRFRGDGSSVSGLAINAFASTGIQIEAGNATIAGSFVGTDISGTVALGNEMGIVAANAPNVRIGGPALAQRNLVSGNVNDGIHLTGPWAATGGIIVNNYVGTNAAGAAALANRKTGIFFNAANSNRIGGPTSAERNIISGNGEYGIYLYNGNGFAFSVAGNEIQGNFIGADATGSFAIANQRDGVVLAHLSDYENKVGGDGDGEGNLISGNRGNGIVIVGQESDNSIRGNRIGVKADGSALGNGANGIVSDADSRTVIFANTIAHNGMAGIAKTGFSSSAGYLNNAIYANGGLGIDLGSQGVTPNDPGDADTGANNLQNFPVLNAVTPWIETTTITGTLNSLADRSFLIQFFVNASGDASGYGEGERFLGELQIATNASGNASFSKAVSGALSQTEYVTATATLLDSQGKPSGTSEFSAAVEVGPSPLVVVAVRGNLLLDTDGDGAPNSFPFFNGLPDEFVADIRVAIDQNLNGIVDLGDTILNLDEDEEPTFSTTVLVPIGEFQLVAQSRSDRFAPIQPAGGVFHRTVTQNQSFLVNFLFEVRHGLSGVIFEDKNFNGIKEPGEPGRADQSLFVDINGNGLRDSFEPAGVTDENGAYSISGISPGRHAIIQDLPEGWIAGSSPGLNWPALVDFDGGFLGSASSETLNLANFRLAELSGILFDDADYDGVRDPDEAGLSDHRMVYVDSNNNQAMDTGEMNTQADSDGFYRLSLPWGVHRIREVVPQGWALSSPAQRAFTIDVTSSGQSFPDRDFGNFVASSVGGQKFDDANANGQHDPDETGLNGLVIELVHAATGAIVATQVTRVIDINHDLAIDPITEHGRYLFDGVIPGQYYVREIVPEGYLQTAPAGSIRLASQNAIGEIGNYFSGAPSLSGDGRWVAFESFAANLVAGDTNQAADIFVRDMQTGVVERVSIDVTFAQGNGDSLQPSISADGNVVAFLSHASNLAPGDTNGVSDIFVHDRRTHVTRRVNVGVTGAQANGESLHPVVSGNGRYVAFESTAGNLVPGDINGVSDIFVYDLVTSLIHRVGRQNANGPSHQPALSADGRYVAYTSYASNLVDGDTNQKLDVFLVDRQQNGIERISVGSTGAQGDGDSFEPSVSADGRFVAFTSKAGNFVAGDTNRDADVFVFDRAGSNLVRLSQSLDGATGNAASGAPRISADGRYVVFESYASNLVGSDENGVADIFLADRRLQAVKRLSHTQSGLGNEQSFAPAISADGSVVAFATHADNLTPADANDSADVVVANTRGEWFVSVTPQNPAEGIDFGNLFRLGRIEGQKFDDHNGNGQQEGDEPGLDGWNIQLVDPATGKVLSQTVTASLDLDGDGAIDPVLERGWYRFDAVEPGEYDVREVPREGWIQVAPENPSPTPVPTAFVRRQNVKFEPLPRNRVGFAQSIAANPRLIEAVAPGQPEQLPILYVHGFNDDGMSWGVNGGRFLEQLADITGNRPLVIGSANLTTYGVQYWAGSDGDADADDGQAYLKTLDDLVSPTNPHNSRHPIGYFLDNFDQLLHVLPVYDEEAEEYYIPATRFIDELVRLAERTDYNRNGAVEAHADDLKDLLLQEFTAGDLRTMPQVNFVTISAGGLDTRAMLDLMQDTGDTMKAERVANVVYAAPPFGGSTLAELADVLYRDTVTPDTFSDPWMHQVLLQLGNKPVIREVLRFALTNPVAASLSAANAYLESAIVSKVDSILESFDAVANVLFGTSLDMSGTFLAANAAIADEVAPLSPVRGLCNAINFLKPIVTLLGGFPGYPKVRDDLRPYEAVHDNLLRWDANRLAQQFVIWGEAGLQGSGFHLGLAPSLEDAGENPASLHAFGTRSRNGTDFDELGTQADDGAVTRSSALALSDLAGGYMKALYGFKKQSHTTITEDLRLAEDNGTTVGEVLVETLLAPVTDLELVGPMGVVDPANRSYSVGATSTFVLKPEARTFYDLMGGRTFEVTPARVQYRVVKLPVAVDPVFGDWIDVDHRTFVGSFSALSHRYGLSGEQPFRLEWRSFNQNGGAEGIRSATFRIDTIAPSLTSKLVENPTNPMDTTQVYSRVSSARNTAAFRPDRLTPISSPLLSQIVGKTETEWVVNLAQDKRIKLAFDGPAKVEYAWDSPTLANARTVSTTTGPTIVTLPIRASGRTVGAPIGATFLTPGRHVLYFRAADSVGNATAIQAMTLFVDNQAPVLSMDASSLQIVGPKSVVTITADDAEVFVQSFQVTLAGVAVDIKNGRPFSMDQLDLTGVASGSTVSLVASATDRVGNTSTRTFSLVLDRNGPELNLDAVKSATRTVTQEWYTSAPTIEVFLSASDALAGLDASNGITWTVARAGTSQVALKQGELTATDKPGVFTGVIPLLEGASAFTARAIDGVGNQSTVSFLIHRQPALRVSVARGEIARDVDFANFHVGQLAGSVFDDRNANGLKDATEPNLGGSPVYLDLNRDGVHNPSEPLAVTDADGHYTFSQVGPGTYRVNVGADSLTQITAGAYGFLATARGGATVDLPAFGLARPGDVTGIVFHDSNGDGDRDAGELTFGGQLVYLDINGNQQLDVSDPRTNTNSSGAYSFNGLSVGSYVVRATRPAGFHFTAGGAGRSIQVLGGQITQSADFGFFKPISISGVVFNDLNGANGRQSGEPGLIGYKVFNDANGNGVQDTSEPTLVTSGNTAGIAGQFTVLNVLPGTLRLTVSLPSGWVATTPANGFLIDPVSGVNRSNVDLGLFKKTSINGVVSERTSPTNVQKAPGQTVFLDVNNNGLNDDGVTTVTSSQGAYSFNQLGPGPHRVRVELQPNWVKVDPTTAGHDVFPQSNTPAINKNFTLFRGATITGSVYNDQNGSRIRDAGEPAFDNWVVYLDANANNVQDTNETIARTGADGVYTFTGLAPAVHRVRQALPASFVQLTPRTSQQHNVTVTNGGQLVSQRDFGNRGNTAGFPFSDNFNRADNTDLGVNWEETFGNVEVRGNKMFRKTGSAAIAVYNGAAAADVMVQGDVDLNSADLNVLQRVEVGLVARYVGPTGPANTYVGVIVREKSKPDVAEIWSFSASGSKSVLASAPITAVRGRLSFTAMGRRLTLSLDDTELVTMEAESILGPGFVGVYLTKDRSIDNFNAQVPIGIGG